LFSLTFVSVYLHVEDEAQLPDDPSNSSEKESKASFVEEMTTADEPPGIGDEDLSQEPSKGKVDRLQRSFNLIKNLEKIHCERFAEALIKEGFGDEV
jgi:hypothetical protein